MPEYEVERDDYIALVTKHKDIPEPIEVAENHEIYDELTQGANGGEPLQWTKLRYDNTEIEEILETFCEGLDGSIKHWQMQINSEIGEDVLENVPVTQITGVIDYEIECRGYGKIDSELGIIFEYDESTPRTRIKADVDGEPDFEIPKHVKDRAAMKRNIQEDIINAAEEINQIAEELPQLEP